MKKLIIETFIKGVVFSLGIILTILGVYGVNSLVNIKSVDTTTVLTSNLWNETMSSLTGAINTLGNEVVKLTGDQTISGKKIFSTPVSGVTPVANTDLTTKDYVDSKVGATSSNITGGQLCPTTISDIKNSDTISNAVKVCRDMGNGYRLPTFEELSCFINTPLSGSNSNSLLTRTSYGINYLSIMLSSGYIETVPYGTAKYYRCVK